jgi:hypothetical protein
VGSDYSIAEGAGVTGATAVGAVVTGELSAPSTDDLNHNEKGDTLVVAHQSSAEGNVNVSGVSGGGNEGERTVDDRGEHDNNSSEQPQLHHHHQQQKQQEQQREESAEANIKQPNENNFEQPVADNVEQLADGNVEEPNGTVPDLDKQQSCIIS